MAIFSAFYLTVRFLVDENFPKRAVDVLSQREHDVIWIRTYSPGMEDKSILALAASEGRLLLTLDKDFQQLAISGRADQKSFGVVVFRTHPATSDRIVRLLMKLLNLNRVWVGFCTIITETSVQMFPLRSKLDNFVR